MRLRTLQLRQFRCFEALSLDLPEGIALFHGNNARGKTTILEAVCVLLRLQSPRASALAECIRFSEKAFAVGGMLEGRDESELRFQYREGGRKLTVDGETQKRAADYLRYSSLVVWMANDDLALVRGGGEGRRRYLDFMAGQLFPGYREAVKNYEKALRTRNFLLKRDASPKWDQIDSYTRILAKEGRTITAFRSELVAALAPRAVEAQAAVGGGRETLTLRYESASGDGDDLSATLVSARDEEFRKRRTLFGPHLDDLALELDGMPAAKFASEGQQRTLALALKLGQARHFLAARNEAPVMLIDDVFGELDPNRRNALMEAWPAESQKLITTTNLDWLDERFGDVPRFLVSGEGTVSASSASENEKE